jgi:hypothetical protein
MRQLSFSRHFCSSNPRDASVSARDIVLEIVWMMILYLVGLGLVDTIGKMMGN